MAQTPPPPPPPPPDGLGGSGLFRPRGLGEILSAAFDLYKDHWQALIQIVAVVVIPLTLLQYFLTDQLTSTTTVHGVNGTVTVSTSSAGKSIVVGLLLAVIPLLVTQVLTGAITRASAGSLIGETPTPGDAFSYGFARLGSILLVSILVALIVGVGFILLIIPGIIFAVKLIVAIPALVVENRRGTDAISRSWSLTTGHFWHVLGTWLVAAIIAALVSGIFTAFGGTNWFVRGVLASIGAVITMPFTALVTMLLYMDLRVRKEAFNEETLRRDLAASRN
jgi:Membrane domain of glycerophosphoryl diester phosphodiesterase